MRRITTAARTLTRSPYRQRRRGAQPTGIPGVTGVIRPLLKHKEETQCTEECLLWNTSGCAPASPESRTRRATWKSTHLVRQKEIRTMTTRKIRTTSRFSPKPLNGLRPGLVWSPVKPCSCKSAPFSGRQRDGVSAQNGPKTKSSTVSIRRTLNGEEESRDSGSFGSYSAPSEDQS